MKWTKFREPYRAELIKEVILEDNKGIVLSADKENPVPGMISHYGHKKIGRNNVKMYRFWPDAAPDESWELSSNWFRLIRKAGGANG